jgi:ketosteroid isomerase-like protein
MRGEDVIARADAWQQAIESRDAAAATQILHDDYALVLVQPVRAVMPRQRWLATLDDYIVHAYEIHERLVDVNGDTAAVLQRVDQRATVLGEDRSGTFVISDTWLRVEGEWRVWRRHSTPFTAPRMPGVETAE